MPACGRLALVSSLVISAVGASTASAAPAELADLTDGRYWVRRVVRDEAIGSEGHGADGHVGERWVRRHTACQPLDLTTDGPRRQVRLGDVTFELGGRTGGKMLGAPVRTSVRPPLELPGECQQPVADLSGPIYADEASCRAVPDTVIRRCLGVGCRHDGDAPFMLPACDAALRQLEAAAAPVLTASHAEIARSLARLQRITGRGGRLWTFEADEGRCYPLAVTPRPDDQVALRERFTTTDGARVTYTAEAAFEPMFHVARYANESRWEEGPDGGGGYEVGPFTAGLYLGRDVVLLGTRWLYFTRAACAAHTSAP